jgi:hypothetical protein
MTMPKMSSLEIRRWESLPGFEGLTLPERRSPAGWRPIALELAKTNGGKLPCPSWLMNNGYSGLQTALRKYPEVLGDIPIEMKRRTPEDYVPLATELAARHGGVLPSIPWMQKNKHTALLSMMRAHPELFIHIEQRKTWVPVGKVITAAVELARGNGGTLPSQSKLSGAVRYRVARLIDKQNREFFRRFKRVKGGKGGCHFVLRRAA